MRIAGVILNRVASEKHRAMVAEAIAALDIPVLGAVPREAALALPERHLGLVQAGEHADLAALIDRLAAMAERHLDLDAIAALAAPLKLAAPRRCYRRCRRPGNASRWRTTRLSASSIRISSMPGAAPAPRSCRSRRSPTSRRPNTPTVAGCRAAIPNCMPMRSPARGRFMSGLRRFAETRPVHGECGGYMVLGESIEDAAGRRHAMAGLLGHATSFAKRKLHLGYRTARLLGDGVLGGKDAIVRGHEFHYATLTAAGAR